MTNESAQLLLVRHAESMGNVAREGSEATDSEIIAIDTRDADVPLSPIGRGQRVHKVLSTAGDEAVFEIAE